MQMTNVLSPGIFITSGVVTAWLSDVFGKLNLCLPVLVCVWHQDFLLMFERPGILGCHVFSQIEN